LLARAVSKQPNRGCRGLSALASLHDVKRPQSAPLQKNVVKIASFLPVPDLNADRFELSSMCIYRPPYLFSTPTQNQNLDMTQSPATP
jgi:hypothetical protein